jgi:hypothetical protein
VPGATAGSAEMTNANTEPDMRHAGLFLCLVYGSDAMARMMKGLDRILLLPYPLSYFYDGLEADRIITC